VRVRFDFLQRARQREQRSGLQSGLPPLDPQGVDDVELVAQRQIL